MTIATHLLLTTFFFRGCLTGSQKVETNTFFLGYLVTGLLSSGGGVVSVMTQVPVPHADSVI